MAPPSCAPVGSAPIPPHTPWHLGPGDAGKGGSWASIHPSPCSLGSKQALDSLLPTGRGWEDTEVIPGLGWPGKGGGTREVADPVVASVPPSSRGPFTPSHTASSYRLALSPPLPPEVSPHLQPGPGMGDVWPTTSTAG